MRLLIDEEAGQAASTRTRSATQADRQRRAERHRLHRRDRQGRHAQRNAAAPTSRARACSATCCRWSRARRSAPSTAWCSTDHILFIASGAFHLAKPSDLIPELQGRFPIRVELQSLSVADFESILTQTHASLVKQYQALLATEGVTLEFTPEGITRLAQHRLRGQRAHREHRRAPPVDGDGAAARRSELRRDQAGGPDGRASTRPMWTQRLQALSHDEDLSRFIL